MMGFEGKTGLARYLIVVNEIRLESWMASFMVSVEITRESD